eukprot:2125379-Pyramimonas_sp.AAC.1
MVDVNVTPLWAWRLQEEEKLTVQRDPSRLLKPTKASENRLNAEEEPGALFAERPQNWARATPSWMRK